MWTSASYSENTDDTGIGTVSATFTDTDSTTFTYARRVDVSGADKDAFKLEANAALDKWQKKKTRVSTREQQILDFLNA